MGNLSKFVLDLGGSGWLYLLFAGLIIAFSLFIYRFTNPPVSQRWRYFLMTLRSLTLGLVLLVLFEPILSLVWQRFQKPIVAVLVDDSASMQLVDPQGERGLILKKILKDPLFKKLKSDYEIRYFQFAATLTPNLRFQPDSLQFRGDGTDLQKALEALHEQTADQYLRGLVVLTDGADNLGENPLRYATTFGMPIFPIAIGDPTEARDVLITQVFTNQITYLNNELPVAVTIRSAGYENKRIQILLKDAQKTLATQQVTLSREALEQKVTFQIKPAQAGMAKYRVEIPGQAGELTTLNNQKSFYVKVLPSRMKILLVAGAPSADFSFLKRTLIANENIELTTFVEQKDGVFYDGAALNPNEIQKYDAFIFLDFPRASSEPRGLTALLNQVTKHDQPLLYLAGPGTDFRRLAPLNAIFPLVLNIPKEKERLVQMTLTEEGNVHPIFRQALDPVENARVWHDLPPVYYSLFNVRLNPWARVLAEVDKVRSNLPPSLPTQPVVTVAQLAGQKVVAVLAYDLWRWNFLVQGIGKENLWYPALFNRLIRWLVTREESQRVRIQAEQEIFRGGAPVTFSAQVYFEDYQPMDEAEVQVTVKQGATGQTMALTGKGNGQYAGALPAFEGGDYRFHGIAKFKNQVVGADSGRFSVEPFSIEFQNTRMNEILLQKMAQVTNGHYFTPQDYHTLPQYLNFPPKRFIESREWQLWNKLALLLVVIGLLSTEWLTRKKKGML